MRRWTSCARSRAAAPTRHDVPVATWDDVRRLALALPETAEQDHRGLPSWRVKGKLFVWDRPLRTRDLHELGDAAPAGPVLGARVEHLVAEEAWLSVAPTRVARAYLERAE